MLVEKWNTLKRKYEPYKIPAEWKCETYLEDLEEYINCAQCGRLIKFGDSYTSLEIHNSIGFGYCVCEKCHDNEFLRKINRR